MKRPRLEKPIAVARVFRAGAVLGLLNACPGAAQGSADLAKQLANPIASLISVPFQLNVDSGYGPDNGARATVNVQPVVPFSLSEDWNLISRTILPFGALANHVWSFAGDDNGPDVDATFLQPFLNYTTPSAVTLFLNAEATYDWSGNDIAIPINLGVNKLVSVGDKKIQLGAGVRYWVAEADNGPEGFGARVNVVFLFPK